MPSVWGALDPEPVIWPKTYVKTAPWPTKPPDISHSKADCANNPNPKGPISHKSFSLFTPPNPVPNRPSGLSWPPATRTQWTVAPQHRSAE